MSSNNEITNQTHPLIRPEHFRRLAVVYCRQSSEKQVEQNTGSTQFQRNLTEVARQYGWPDSQIIIIDEDLGKSGSTTVGRTGWQHLEEMIEANQVGAVFAANISRLARNVYDFEVFRIRAALHYTLLFSDGRLINPADSNDAIVSQMMAMVASYENRKRAELMMQSRLAKARRGMAVSNLPTGWIKLPDGKYDFDPEAKGTIQLVIDTFWKTGSIHRTVKALRERGVKIPYRDGAGGAICFREPTSGRVRRILTNENYSGTYTYSKSRSQPGGPIMAKSYSRRITIPEDEWIKIPDHHPGYMSPEEQEQIRAILKKNQFHQRQRPGRGPAPLQGLLRCAVCGGTLSVFYPDNRYMYVCSRTQQYGEEPCTRFMSRKFERAILQEVFKILKRPPLEMLKTALEASRHQKQRRLQWIESERERYAHEERLARERADLTRGRLPSVHYDALERLEKAMQDRKEFERNTALTELNSEQESEEELEELCRIASEVPSLWEHEAITHRERKELLRCVIDHIVVTRSRSKIDATIVWQSGARTLLTVWQRGSLGNLVRELHAQKLTAPEIREHLAAGKTSNGQAVSLSLGRLYIILKTLGLKPHLRSLGYFSALQKAIDLDREGQSMRSIAQYLNKQGFTKGSGKPWTHHMIRDLIFGNGKKLEPLEKIHQRRSAWTRARLCTNRR